MGGPTWRYVPADPSAAISCASDEGSQLSSQANWRHFFLALGVPESPTPAQAGYDRLGINEGNHMKSVDKCVGLLHLMSFGVISCHYILYIIIFIVLFCEVLQHIDNLSGSSPSQLWPPLIHLAERLGDEDGELDLDRYRLALTHEYPRIKALILFRHVNA